MASRTVVIMTDDLTGQEDKSVQTVGFSLDGIYYEIDLSDKNHSRLQDALDPFIKVAREDGTAKANGKTKTKTRTRIRTGATGDAAKRPAVVNREQNKAIRAWAKRTGKEVSDRGRIPQEIVDQFHAEGGLSRAAVVTYAAEEARQPGGQSVKDVATIIPQKTAAKKTTVKKATKKAVKAGKSNGK